MELYGIVLQETSHLWELYDKHFWSTRVGNNSWLKIYPELIIPLFHAPPKPLWRSLLLL